MFIINVAMGYLAYEIGVGVQVVRNQIFKTGKKWGYIPPTLFYAKDREKYLEWKEWKGDSFK